MFHWCQSETDALLAAIPVVGTAYFWLRAKLARIWKWVKR
jgi:hypothetical protein